MPSSSAPAARPLIGVTMRLYEPENSFYLRRFYAEAVEAAGGAPVYIPLIPNREYLAALIGRLDGLMLSGSNSDVDPAFYGEEPHPKLGSVTPERDETDLALLEMAEERAMPVLAICFGLQSLNVARGGSLIQDIESQVENPIKHEQGAPANRPSHNIEIEAESLLARLAGGVTVRVNSSHHQAIKRVGRNLKVIARAADGVIEAVTDTRADRFVLGVQWHPEVGWQRDNISQAIFKRFIEESNRYRER
ncbi:MAG: gamma-glutamyl-gamma-aminobutyrate hydrolase family protein [Blastocatellia bacterium]